MRCPFRKLISTTKEIKEDGLITEEVTTEAFAECNIVFVIGGLGFGDERDVKSIVSRLIKSSCVDDCKKLKNPMGDDGYVIRADSQMLVLLPDEPEQIEAIMQGAITGYIKIRGNARA